MPFQNLIQSNLVIVRWSAFVTDDVEAVLSFLKQACQQAKHPIHYIALIPESVSPPQGVVRNEFVRRTDEMLRICQTVHLVLEGSGFMASFKRSVLTGMLLAAKSRSQVFAHASLREALQRIAPLDPQLQRNVTSSVQAL